MALHAQEPTEGWSRSQWIPAADLRRMVRAECKRDSDCSCLISSSSQDDSSVEGRCPASVFFIKIWDVYLIRQYQLENQPISHSIQKTPAGKPPNSGQDFHLNTQIADKSIRYSFTLQRLPLSPLSPKSTANGRIAQPLKKPIAAGSPHCRNAGKQDKLEKYTHQATLTKAADRSFCSRS